MNPFHPAKLMFSALILLTASTAGAGSVEVNCSSSQTPCTAGSMTRISRVNDRIVRGSVSGSDEEMAAVVSKFGIKTILNLQGEPEEQSDVAREREWARQNGIRFYQVGLESAWGQLGPIPYPELLTHDVDLDDVVRALAILAQAKGPVYVHCFHGKDRTGVVVGLYRVFFEGMSSGDAFREMKSFGFTPMEFKLLKFWKQNSVAGSPVQKRLQRLGLVR